MSATPTIDRDTYFRFYAAEISYFSAKVRPALRYKRVPYIELLPTPAAYREVILPRTGLAFIPVVLTPQDEVWQDSSEILDALEARFPQPPLYPSTPVQRLIALLLELYSDEFLVLPALHYRWSFPESEAKARADFAAANGDLERAMELAGRIKGATSFVGIVPQTIPAIEAHTQVLLDALSAHFAAQPCLLGGRPSLADCALMGPLYAHLYLDAVPARLVRERAPRVSAWIERMNHPDPDDSGEWLASDALPPTLRPLLQLVGSDAVPLILDTLRAFDTWADDQPAGTEPPRAVGAHRTRLRGVGLDRMTSPYTMWMAQRPLDAYRALPAADRARVDQALAGTGCEALFAYTPKHRVGKRQFKIALEN